MMSSEPTPRNWRRIFAVSAIILALLFLGIALTFIYGGPSIRKWRAMQLSAKAERLFGEKKYADAQKSAAAAYQLSPSQPEVQRTVGKILAQIGHPQAIDLLRALYTEKQANTEDKVLYARLLVKKGRIQEAEAIIREALNREPKNAEIRLLLAKTLLIEGDNAGMEKQLRRILSENPDNQEALVLLGRLMALDPDPDQRRQGIDTLKKIAAGKDMASLDALKYLLRISQENSVETKEWAKALEEHPLRDEDAKLLGADWEIRLDPANAPAVYDRLMKEHRGASSDAVKDFAGWLNQHSQYNMVLRLFPKETAITRRDYFLIWLDAKAGLGEWRDIEKVLQTPTIPLEQPFVFLFGGRAAAARGDSARADWFYSRAITAAAREPQTLWYFAGYFQQMGKIAFTKQALLALTKSTTTARAGYQALLAIAAREQNTANIASLLDEMRQRWPKDIAVENDQRYFNLLTGKAQNQQQDAERLVKLQPSSLPFRTTLALLYLKKSKKREALDLYKDLSVDWTKMNPALLAVYAAVLEANGQHEKAVQAASAVPQSALRKEEKDLIAPLISPPAN